MKTTTTTPPTGRYAPSVTAKPGRPQTSPKTSKDKAQDEITVVYRIPAGMPRTVIHFGISNVTRARIERIAARRGKSAEEYLSEAMSDRIAQDFVSDLEAGGALSPRA